MGSITTFISTITNWGSKILVAGAGANFSSVTRCAIVTPGLKEEMAVCRRTRLAKLVVLVGLGAGLLFLLFPHKLPALLELLNPPKRSRGN